MVLSALVIALVASVPPGTAADASTTSTRLLVLDPRTEDGFPPAVPRLILTAIADALSADARIQVITARDVHDLVSLAAEQQLDGCDSSTCVGEIAGALGARHIIFSDVARLGGEVVLSLRLLDTKTGETVARQTVRAGSSTELERAAPAAARELVRDVAPARPALDRPLVIAGAVVAVAGAAAAVGLGGWSASLGNTLYLDAASKRADKTFAYGAMLPVAAAALVAAGIAVGGGALAFVGAEGP